MDIYSFVNSKDIRKHLRDIKYEFNSLETAWLIYSCHRLCYNEKKELWQEIIDTMPDCAVPKKCLDKDWNSLHEMLREYMDTVDEIIREFLETKKPREYVYMYKFILEGDSRCSEEYETVFPSLEKCMQAYNEEVADESNVKFYGIKRQSLIDTENEAQLIFRGNGELEDIFRYNTKAEKVSDILYESFEQMWFDFPTPFKRGDIVWIPPHYSQSFTNNEGGFVLEKLFSWYASDLMKETADYTDMIAYGYFVGETGIVYYDDTVSYMDMEYYKPTKESEKFLLALSAFLKGNMHVDYLLHIYLRTLTDIKLKDMKRENWYTEEVFKDIGID